MNDDFRWGSLDKQKADGWFQWRWLDDKLDVSSGMGSWIALLAVAVFVQVAMTLLQIFCLPCLRTIFEFLRL